jgi:hypothetical protein
MSIHKGLEERKIKKEGLITQNYFAIFSQRMLRLFKHFIVQSFNRLRPMPEFEILKDPDLK